MKIRGIQVVKQQLQDKNANQINCEWIRHEGGPFTAENDLWFIII